MQQMMDLSNMDLTSGEVECPQDGNDKTEAEYRSIFNNIPNPVFIIDSKNLRILDCNESVREVYGFSKSELLETSFLNFFEEGEHQNYALELRTSDVLNHVKQVTREGVGIFVNIRVCPYQYMGRKALLVTASDVIRIMVVRQQLIQTNKMSTLGEMATGIAHELNQPLSVIKTASSFLLNRINNGEDLKENVLKMLISEIDGHVDRASGIINHIREFGRKSEAKREPVQINAVLQKALEIFSQQLKLRNIAVRKKLAADLPVISGDPNRLEQVFINLLINARDAIAEKREELGRTDTDERITLRTVLRGQKVRVEVADTGTGIAPALLDKIFEPFFTTKQVGRGTGLGLSISYGIVQDHRGTLQVETVEKMGTTFILEFPVQVDADGR